MRRSWENNVRDRVTRFTSLWSFWPRPYGKIGLTYRKVAWIVPVKSHMRKEAAPEPGYSCVAFDDSKGKLGAAILRPGATGPEEREPQGSAPQPVVLPAADPRRRRAGLLRAWGLVALLSPARSRPAAWPAPSCAGLDSPAARRADPDPSAGRPEAGPAGPAPARSFRAPPQPRGAGALSWAVGTRGPSREPCQSRTGRVHPPCQMRQVHSLTCQSARAARASSSSGIHGDPSELARRSTTLRPTLCRVSA
jgi:hypothetical protein